MGKALTAQQRRNMSQSEFAGPDHSFPVNDKKHDRLAISGATRSYNAGNISKSEEEAIQAKARKKLGKGASHEERLHKVLQNAILGKR